MKILTITCLILNAALACAAERSPTQSGLAAIAGFEYIRDAKAFQPENSRLLTAELQKALRFAKALLALRFEREVSGVFRIAEAPWGFQINFSALKIRKEGAWVEIPEGFGEIFLNKNSDRIQIDLGS